MKSYLFGIQDATVQPNQTKPNAAVPSESCTVSQVIPLTHTHSLDQGMGNSGLEKGLILLRD